MAKLHHKNCDNPDCSQCLADCVALRTELEERSGIDGNIMDHLGKYRSWLDSEGWDSETDAGWPKSYVFDEEMISAFLNSLQE